MEEAIVTDNFCLIKNGESVVINKQHDYYYQVQGQLLITGAAYCEFIVYTKSDLSVVRVLPDNNFQMNMLNTLCDFYKTYAMPYLEKNTDDLPISSV